MFAGKQFDLNSGNYYNIKTISAVPPVVLTDDGNTITFNLSGTISNAIAGLTPIKTTFYGTGSQIYFNLPSVALPTDPSAYRIDINGVVQEPGADYSIITSASPYQIRFTTAPNNAEKIVVVAFAPSLNNFSLPPITNAQSILGNPTYQITNSTSISVSANQVLGNAGSGIAGISLATNQVLANTGSGIAGLDVSYPNNFVGNIGGGLGSVNLSKWNQVTTNYSILTSDFGATIAVNSFSPTTITIPNNNFPAGFQCTVIGLGIGSVTFSPTAGSPGTPSGTGVILNQAYGLTQLSARWSAATIIYSGNPFVGWTIFGDLA